MSVSDSSVAGLAKRKVRFGGVAAVNAAGTVRIIPSDVIKASFTRFLLLECYEPGGTLWRGLQPAFVYCLDLA
jgi:hypothetical protein